MSRPLTRTQKYVLNELSFSPRTPAWLGVRSDVLWRLEERGLVGAGIGATHGQQTRWSITREGREAAAEAGADR